MMQVVLSDSDLAIRRSGIELLDQVEIGNASALLANLLATETDLRLSQAAISTLGRLREPAAGDVIADLLDQMLAGKIRPELHLEILEAAGKSPSVAVKQHLAQFAQTLKPADPVSPYRVTLVGGDATIGKKIYDENDALGCLRCHAINGKGGTVGPDLAGIGSKKSREYLLQAIIEPNATFAEGHERIVLVLKNGDTVAGLVEAETDESITLSTPETRVVQKSEIQTRHPAISPMPPGLEKLISHRDLRNLLEYLTTL